VVAEGPHHSKYDSVPYRPMQYDEPIHALNSRIGRPPNMVQQMAVQAAQNAASSVAAASSAAGAASSSTAGNVATGVAVAVATAVIAASISSGLVMSNNRSTGSTIEKESVSEECIRPDNRSGSISIDFLEPPGNSLDELEITELEKLFVAAYNEVSQGCNELYQREMQRASLLNWDRLSEHDLTTEWEAYLTCNGCPPFEPMFESTTTASTSNRFLREAVSFDEFVVVFENRAMEILDGLIGINVRVLSSNNKVTNVYQIDLEEAREVETPDADILASSKVGSTDFVEEVDISPSKSSTVNQKNGDTPTKAGSSQEVRVKK
jgi:hypothetical protein